MGLLCSYVLVGRDVNKRVTQRGPGNKGWNQMEASQSGSGEVELTKRQRAVGLFV